MVDILSYEPFVTRVTDMDATIKSLFKMFKDNRLGVEILDLSQELHFKYRTFRFSHVKTLDQRIRGLNVSPCH